MVNRRLDDPVEAKRIYEQIKALHLANPNCGESFRVRLEEDESCGQLILRLGELQCLFQLAQLRCMVYPEQRESELKSLEAGLEALKNTLD